MAAMVASSPSQLNKRCRPAPPKTFQCRGYGDCKMVFSRSEHLARHIRKHTGERPFACHCSKQFSRLDNLRQHAQTVHADKQDANERMMRELTTLHAAMAAASKAGSGRGRRSSSNNNSASSMMPVKREPSMYEGFQDPASTLWQMPEDNDVDMPSSESPTGAHSPDHHSFRPDSTNNFDLGQSFLDSKPTQSFREQSNNIIGLGADQSFRSSPTPSTRTGTGRTPSPPHSSSQATSPTSSAPSQLYPRSADPSPYNNQSFPPSSRVIALPQSQQHPQLQHGYNNNTTYSQLSANPQASIDDDRDFFDKFDFGDRPLSSSGAGWREIQGYANAVVAAAAASASDSADSSSPFSFNAPTGGPSSTHGHGHGSGSGSTGYGTSGLDYGFVGGHGRRSSEAAAYEYGTTEPRPHSRRFTVLELCGGQGASSAPGQEAPRISGSFRQKGQGYVESSRGSRSELFARVNKAAERANVESAAAEASFALYSTGSPQSSRSSQSTHSTPSPTLSSPYSFHHHHHHQGHGFGFTEHGHGPRSLYASYGPPAATSEYYGRTFNYGAPSPTSVAPPPNTFSLNLGGGAGYPATATAAAAASGYPFGFGSSSS
ncbi:Up in starvation [Stygiomarasmius scandens]|uniref:Up in starvation n=1 Tax=Marasmiellus scandens TaxID=2682957 RepID=A0ABR1JIF3_9AGAR